MTERQEYAESVRSQFRALATGGSFDGAWQEARPQRVRVERRVTVPDTDGSELFVNFHAERFTLGHSPRLSTRYEVTAGIAHDDLEFEFIPSYVQFALQQRRLHEWDPSRNDVHMLFDVVSDSDRYRELLQLQYQDCIDVSDISVRFEREVGFEYNGRAQLLQEKRSDVYYTSDDNRQVTGAFGEVGYTHQNDDPVSRWLEKDVDGFTDTYPIELLQHPDLQKLEYTYEKNQFKDFLSFAELVQRVEQDKKLDRISRDACRQKTLALLAFLRCETPASTIYAMLYE